VASTILELLQIGSKQQCDHEALHVVGPNEDVMDLSGGDCDISKS
jgi:hypothetical protein